MFLRPTRAEAKCALSAQTSALFQSPSGTRPTARSATSPPRSGLLRGSYWLAGGIRQRVIRSAAIYKFIDLHLAVSKMVVISKTIRVASLRKGGDGLGL